MERVIKDLRKKSRVLLIRLNKISFQDFNLAIQEIDLKELIELLDQLPILNYLGRKSTCHRFKYSNSICVNPTWKHTYIGRLIKLS